MVHRLRCDVAKMILFVIVFVTTLQVQAQDFSIKPGLSAYYCFEDLLLDRFRVLPKFPIGCEVIDCCPGCPGGRDFLDISAESTAHGASKLALAFTDPDGFKRPKPEATDGIFQIDPGSRQKIGGVRVADDSEARFIEPTLAFNTQEIETALEENDSVEGAVQLKTQLGPITVFDYQFGWSVSKCNVPDLSEDTIQLTSNANSDAAAVVVSGAHSDAGVDVCFHDKVYSVVSSKQIENVVESNAANSCGDESLVFSTGDMMEIEDSGAVFTDTPADVLAVALGDMVQPKLRFWVSDSFVATLAGTVDPVSDLKRAIQIFDDSRCGITFDPLSQMDPLSGIEGDVIDSGLALIELNYILNVLLDYTCDTVAMNGIKTSSFYDPAAINVYYTWGPHTGLYCADSQIMVIGLGSNTETLTHELGHAFSMLWHVQDDPLVAVLGNTNIMSGTSKSDPNPIRTHFTEGQCQRMNVEPTSRINDPIMNLRGGEPEYTCAPFDQSIAPEARCLPLDFNP